jgi:hypothetical protein
MQQCPSRHRIDVDGVCPPGKTKELAKNERGIVDDDGAAAAIDVGGQNSGSKSRNRNALQASELSFLASQEHPSGIINQSLAARNLTQKTYSTL